MQASTSGRNFFGGLIAFVLLFLYLFILVFMMVEAVECGKAGIEACKAAAIDDNQGRIYVVATIGGLISALVIAELAVTPPGQDIAHRFVEPHDPSVTNETPKKKIVRGVIKFFTYSYLLVWVALGLASLVIGVVLFPEASITLRAMGNTWLGLAVAAGYSYFGIRGN